MRVSMLDAFLSTWSNARSTFGEGAPQTGAQYDNSATLRRLQSSLQSAAPDSRWTGAAGDSYGAANAEHAKVLGQLAGLDQRLSADLDQSAHVVAAGRRQLDDLRKWVLDAAATVPPGADRDRTLMPIVQKGLDQLRDIITRSNGELNTIAAGMRSLNEEYQRLGADKPA